MNWTPLRLSLTLAGASFLIVILVPVARPQSTGPPSAGTVRSDLQPTDFQLAQVVVVGDRASLAAAEQNKRDAPDLNVTEALQRITGIQIQRDLAEGSSPSIRGLTQSRLCPTVGRYSRPAPDGTSTSRMSANVTAETEARSRQAGANEFVGKPNQESVLLNMIAGLLHLDWISDGAATQRDAAIEQNTVCGVSKIPGAS